MRKILDVMEHTQPSNITELFVPLVGAAVPFTGSRAWVKAETRESAQSIWINFLFCFLTFVSGILSIIGPPSATQIQAILLEIVKPAFERARPNENLNMNTATKAKRGIGADLAYHDDAESDWKNDLGLVDIVLWCLAYLQASLQLLAIWNGIEPGMSGSGLGVSLAPHHTTCPYLYGWLGRFE